MKAYALDREDVKQAMRVMVQVTKEVKSGRNYLIFAEGTRTKNPNHVNEFKGGSFKCAMKAQCPIVPVALIDSYKPFDVNSIEKIKVQVHFLEPIRYEEYKDMKSVEIAKEVKIRIEKIIEKNDKNFNLFFDKNSISAFCTKHMYFYCIFCFCGSFCKQSNKAVPFPASRYTFLLD